MGANMIIGRRGFLAGLGALIAAPAIVRFESIMPVRAIVPIRKGHIWYDSPSWQKLREIQARSPFIPPDGFMIGYRSSGLVVPRGTWVTEVHKLENWPGKRAIVPA